MCQSQLNCVRRGGVVNKTKGASSCPGRGRPYCRESSEPHQGDIQGEHPLDHFCILFLREKDGARPVSAARWRCSAIGNKNACDATVLQIKPEARPADRRSRGSARPAAESSARGSRQCCKRDSVRVLPPSACDAAVSQTKPSARHAAPLGAVKNKEESNGKTNFYYRR